MEFADSSLILDSNNLDVKKPSSKAIYTIVDKPAPTPSILKKEPAPSQIEVDKIPTDKSEDAVTEGATSTEEIATTSTTTQKIIDSDSSLAAVGEAQKGAGMQYWLLTIALTLISFLIGFVVGARFTTRKVRSKVN